MRNVCVVINVATTKSQVQAIKTRKTVLVIQIDQSVIAHQGATHRHCRCLESGRATQSSKHATHMKSTWSHLLYALVVQGRIVSEDQL